MYASTSQSARSVAIHAQAWVRVRAGVALRDTRFAMPKLRACDPTLAPRSEKTREEDSMAEVSGT